MMRLDKYLAERTGMTRSESRKAITKGRVMVAGKVCRKADTQLDETAAQIALDGAPLAGEYKKYVYIMLNKPEGVVSASRDKRDTTVVDLVAADYPRRELFPAGRLDKTSTGFVLLTDDGALAHDILAPAHHVDKQYLVTLDTPLTEEMRKGFADMCSKVMIRGIHLTARLVPGGTHSEASWEKQLPFMIHTLMYELD